MKKGSILTKKINNAIQKTLKYSTLSSNLEVCWNRHETYAHYNTSI
jgi:hypothetical protein